MLFMYSRRERAYRRACLWVCLFVVRGFIFSFVLRPNSLWKAHLRRSIPNSIYFLQNSTRSVQKAPKLEPKGPNMDPKRPQGPNIDQKGAESGSKNIKKTMPEKRSARGRLLEFGVVPFWSRFGRKGRPRDWFWRSFWCLFPSKMWLKIYPEIEPQQIVNKNMKKTIEKTMRKTKNNPYMFHEKSACKICKCFVFPYRRSIL